MTNNNQDEIREARRMHAYYFAFAKTNVDSIDKLLGAVASAGKAQHHTDCWNQRTEFNYDDHTGNTPVLWIQNAAYEAAAAHTQLSEENARLREAIIILPHDAEPEVGDLIERPENWSQSKNASFIPSEQQRRALMDSDALFKIIQRNGKPVIQEEASHE